MKLLGAGAVSILGKRALETQDEKKPSNIVYNFNNCTIAEVNTVGNSK